MGPLPACVIATALMKRKADVVAALHSDPRFTRTGKTKASRWDVGRTGSFTYADVRPRWGPDTEQFIVGFEKRGLVERTNGNGQIRVTDYGLELSLALREAGGVTA
jgi:hypothetical protein